MRTWRCLETGQTNCLRTTVNNKFYDTSWIFLVFWSPLFLLKSKMSYIPVTYPQPLQTLGFFVSKPGALWKSPAPGRVSPRGLADGEDHSPGGPPRALDRRHVSWPLFGAFEGFWPLKTIKKVGQILAKKLVKFWNWSLVAKQILGSKLGRRCNA